MYINNTMIFTVVLQEVAILLYISDGMVVLELLPPSCWLCSSTIWAYCLVCVERGRGAEQLAVTGAQVLTSYTRKLCLSVMIILRERVHVVF